MTVRASSLSGGRPRTMGMVVVLVVQPENPRRPFTPPQRNLVVHEDDVGNLVAELHSRFGAVAHVDGFESLLPQLAGDETANFLVALDDEDASHSL